MKCVRIGLFLISILHQTATNPICTQKFCGCSLSVFYIKPQPALTSVRIASSCSLSVFYIKPQHITYLKQITICCSLSVFYIKPQLRLIPVRNILVVPYQYSTSNRNTVAGCAGRTKLFLISILHQTATLTKEFPQKTGCSLSIFYIKPQQRTGRGFRHLRCSLSIFYIKPQRVLSYY